MSNLAMAERSTADQAAWQDFDDWAPVVGSHAEGADEVSASSRLERLIEGVLQEVKSGVTLGRGLITEHDEFGQCVVSDPVAAAIGVGDSLAEAAADWEQIARELLQDLRDFDGSLSRRALRQLEYLQTTLG